MTFHPSPEEIAEEYRGLVSALSYRMIQNPEAAKDAAQEAWTEILKSLGTFKGKSKISTWIYTIASRVILKQAKNEKVYSTQYLSEYFKIYVSLRRGKINRSKSSIDSLVENYSMAEYDGSYTDKSQINLLKGALYHHQGMIDSSVFCVEQAYNIIKNSQGNPYLRNYEVTIKYAEAGRFNDAENLASEFRNYIGGRQNHVMYYQYFNNDEGKYFSINIFNGDIQEDLEEQENYLTEFQSETDTLYYGETVELNKVWENYDIPSDSKIWVGDELVVYNTNIICNYFIAIMNDGSRKAACALLERRRFIL